jgi:hypothetical protein
MSNIEYDIEALKSNVLRCDDNIRTFEEAIVKEEQQKLELRRMIRALEEKKANDRKN